MSNNRSTGTLLLLPLIWGCYYVASNAAVKHMSVFPVGIIIRFLTLLLLTALMAGRGQLKELLRVQFVWPRLLLIGTLGFLLDVTAFIGLTLCPAGIGTVLLKCDILFVNLISVLFYHYRFSKKDWLFTLVMLGGVVLVIGIDFGHVNVGGVGNIFFILSALFVSINAFVIKGVQHDDRNPVGDNVVAYYNNVVTMLYFIGFSFFRGELGQLQAFGHEHYVTVALSLAAIGQTLIYVVYYYNLRRYPVWLVKVFLLLMPLVATLLSFLLFGQMLSPLQLAGMAVVLLGAAGIIMEQGKKSHLPPVSDKV
ncbi:MAG: DMT family transporter [Lawsonibacter sp.]